MCVSRGIQARIQDFLQGGVNDGRVLRAPLASAPTGGLGLINIRLRYIASIEYSERFFLIFFFWLVKKFVEKQNWWSRAGGGHDPQTPPPGSAPGYQYTRMVIKGRVANLLRSQGGLIRNYFLYG